MKALDPVYLSSRREMWIIFGVWALFCLWVVGFCSAYGYERPTGDPVLVFGMPAWVFWGVATPWLFATTFSVVFAMFGMKDHSLEDIHPDGERSTDEGGVDT